MTFSRILHPVEYSDEGRLAAAQAFALARSYQTDLHVGARAVTSRPNRARVRRANTTSRVRVTE